MAQGLLKVTYTHPRRVKQLVEAGVCRARHAGVLGFIDRAGQHSASHLHDGDFDRLTLKHTLDGRKWVHVNRWLDDAMRCGAVIEMREGVWRILDFAKANYTRAKYQAFLQRRKRDEELREFSRKFPNRFSAESPDTSTKRNNPPLSMEVLKKEIRQSDVHRPQASLAKPSFQPESVPQRVEVLVPSPRRPAPTPEAAVAPEPALPPPPSSSALQDLAQGTPAQREIAAIAARAMNLAKSRKDAPGPPPPKPAVVRVPPPPEPPPAPAPVRPKPKAAPPTLVPRTSPRPAASSPPRGSLPPSQRATWRPAVNLGDVEAQLRDWGLEDLPDERNFPQHWFGELQRHEVSGSEFGYAAWTTRRAIKSAEAAKSPILNPVAYFWRVVQRQRGARAAKSIPPPGPATPPSAARPSLHRPG